MKDGPGFYVEINHTDSLPAENGPFSSEEEDIVRQVAAKVVEDVITKAAKTASQQNIQDKILELENGLPCFLQAVPSIQIDTVPSMPPSPSEEELSYPGSQVEASDLDTTSKTQDGSTNKDETVSEDIRNFANKYVQDILAMALNFIEKDLLNQDLRNFAGDYVQDILGKAVTMVQKSLEEKNEHIRQVASAIVEDVLKRAAETATEREISNAMIPEVVVPEPKVPSPENKLQPNLPSIQIDTVASRPSSPTEEITTESVKPEVIESKRIEKEDEEARVKLEKEAREFAVVYLKDIITQAIGVAEQKKQKTSISQQVHGTSGLEKRS